MIYPNYFYSISTNKLPLLTVLPYYFMGREEWATTVAKTLTGSSAAQHGHGTALRRQVYTRRGQWRRPRIDRFVQPCRYCWRQAGTHTTDDSRRRYGCAATATTTAVAGIHGRERIDGRCDKVGRDRRYPDRGDDARWVAKVLVRGRVGRWNGGTAVAAVAAAGNSSMRRLSWRKRSLGVRNQR